MDYIKLYDDALAAGATLLSKYQHDLNEYEARATSATFEQRTRVRSAMMLKRDTINGMFATLYQMRKDIS